MISGSRDTANIQAAKRVVDMANEIALLEPDAAPLTVLMKRAQERVKETINPEFKFLEDELSPRFDAVNYSTGYTDGATSVVVDNGSYFRSGHVIRNTDTGEQMLVTGVSTNTLTVTRGWGTTAAAAIADNNTIMIVADASAEGATSATAKTTQEAVKTNYTQIFRTPFEVTGTADASEQYGGKDIAYLQKKHGIEHKRDMERAFLFGEAKNDVSGSKPIRATAGLNSFITTNRTDASGTLTEAEFETFCRTLFRYGSSKKVLFASPLLVSAINSWALGKLQTVSSEKTYGISVKEYLGGHGTLYIVKHNLLEQDYAGYGMAVDTDNVRYRPLRGRDTKLKMNIQANDSDTRKDEYLTEAGLEVKLEKTHGVLYGVTSYA
jgi:hypothetical protein